MNSDGDNFSHEHRVADGEVFLPGEYHRGVSTRPVPSEDIQPNGFHLPNKNIFQTLIIEGVNANTRMQHINTHIKMPQ